jgi:membrane-associated phospholipid phosphatase
LKALIPDGLSTALVIDFGGEPVGAVMLSGLLAAACFLTRRWRLGVLALVGQVVIGGATNVVKPLFDRTIHDGHLSYPSGHTAGATALAFVLGLLIADLLRLGLRAALATVLSVATVIGSVAALAQAWLVAHYATDTVGGYLMALGLVPPTALLIDWIGDHMFGRTSAKP